MDEKQCLECGNHFFGRADKKFCSDSCRNAFNNKLYVIEEALIKKVNRIMRKNWQILNALNPNDKLKVSMAKLAKQGFDFDYITANYFTKEGKEYRFCYDQGYLLLADNNVLLVKRSIEE